MKSFDSVAIQGEPGSFHEQAARQHFGSGCTIIYCRTFADVAAALQQGTADWGIMATSNTIYGPISEVEQLLDRRAHVLEVQESIRLPIHFCLIGLPGASLQQITSVHSQYMALGQCSRFLQTRLPKARLVEESDTALSLDIIRRRGDPRAAALASELAAQQRSMPILARNVEDDSHNATTFAILQPLRSPVGAQ